MAAKKMKKPVMVFVMMACTDVSGERLPVVVPVESTEPAPLDAAKAICEYHGYIEVDFREACSKDIFAARYLRLDGKKVQS